MKNRRKKFEENEDQLGSKNNFKKSYNAYPFKIRTCFVLKKGMLCEKNQKIKENAPRI